jgi:hypothetical protein
VLERNHRVFAFPIRSVDFYASPIANSQKQASEKDSIGKPDACKPPKPDPTVQLCPLDSKPTAKKIKKSERPLLRSLGEINPRTAGGFYLAPGGFYLTVFIWRCVAVCGGFNSAKPPCHSELHSIQSPKSKIQSPKSKLVNTRTEIFPAARNARKNRKS